MISGSLQPVATPVITLHVPAPIAESGTRASTQFLEFHGADQHRPSNTTRLGACDVARNFTSTRRMTDVDRTLQIERVG